MANGFGSFYVGTSGLQSAQNALNVTANNISNVDTTGYVREQVRFSDKHYLTLQNETAKTLVQQSGIGVSIGDVVHARDVFLDKAFRQEAGRESFYSTMYESVSYVEDMFQELNGEEFKNSISDMYTAFQELAKDPADSVNQNLILQKSELFVSRCFSLYQDLQSYQSNLNDQIKADIDTINEIGNRIYDLNLQIQKIEAAGIETAMTLRDERDYLLDELATYANISYYEDNTGFVNVSLEGEEFIDENRCYNIALEMDNGTSFYTPYWPHLSDTKKGNYTEVFDIHADISSEFNNDIGSVKAKLISRGDGYGNYTQLETEEAYRQIESCTVMEAQAQISYLFHSLVTQVNDIFCPNTTLESDISDGTTTIPAGTKILDTDNCFYGEDGELPPREIFTRLGTERYTAVEVGGETYYVYNEETELPSSQYTLGNVAVNEELCHQVTLMPAYTKNGAVAYDMASQLTGLWETTELRINPDDQFPCNFASFYDKMITKLGIEGSSYRTSADTLSDTASSLDNQRQQVIGVSSDEELTHMVKFQAAYNAASRYITVISQMTELIVSLI